MPILYTGTSGWSYSQWKGAFYPQGLPSGDWLKHYAGEFSTVEVNSSFYRPPARASIAKWVAATPEHFRFAVKAWQEITHTRALKNAEEPLRVFFDHITAFGQKCAPILFQLPPSLRADMPLLADFIAQLPQGLKYTIEFRHPSWNDDAMYTLLHRHNIALCHSFLKSAPEGITTADFLYARLHGAETMYKGAYGRDYIEKLRAWCEASGAQDAYIYFNNTMGGTAALDNARQLMHVEPTSA